MRVFLGTLERDSDTAVELSEAARMFGEKILDVSEAQAEAMVRHVGCQFACQSRRIAYSKIRRESPDMDEDLVSLNQT
jgi:hypothetical protein